MHFETRESVGLAHVRYVKNFRAAQKILSFSSRFKRELWEAGRLDNVGAIIKGGISRGTDIDEN
jgi:hypothetical protein